MQRPPKIRRICMRKNNFCQPVTLEWFSIQILVNFDVFKLSWNISLSITGLKSPFNSQQVLWALKCVRKRFNDSLKISEFTMSCIETTVYRQLIAWSTNAKKAYFWTEGNIFLFSDVCCFVGTWNWNVLPVQCLAPFTVLELKCFSRFVIYLACCIVWKLLVTFEFFSNVIGNYIYSLVDAKNATDLRPLSIKPMIAGNL